MVMVEVNTIITRQVAPWISREIFIDVEADDDAGRQAGAGRRAGEEAAYHISCSWQN